MHYPLFKGENLFLDGEKFYIQKSTSLPEYVDKMHYHDYIEITYVTIGECEHAEENETLYAKNGALFVINPGVPHANYRKGNDKNRFVAYDIAFTPDFLDPSLTGTPDFSRIGESYLFRSLLKEGSKPFSHVNLKDKSFYEIEYLFAKLLEEYTEKRDGYYDMMRTQLCELIIRILRKTNVKPLKPQKKASQREYVKQAVQYIDTHYKERISVQYLAEKALCSKSYFSQTFKEYTGLSIFNYTQKIRIERACDMLWNTNMKIHAIATQTGFNDLKFFYTVFKKITKTTPSAYRQNQTGLS